MSFDSVPLWVVFVGTILVVMASIEAGYRLAKLSHRHSQGEKEAPVSGVSGAILGLTAFMLVFTFNIVAERADTKKALVREDANAIRTAFLRANFLPEPHRAEAKSLLGKYLELRLTFVEAGRVNTQTVDTALVETDRIQRRLWEIAVSNAERDMNSDVAALYVEALNNVFEVNASRVAIGLQARIPIGVWIVLYGLMVLGMMSIGYLAGIVGSKWSKVTVILAVAFAMMITIIAFIDRPGGSHVTQQPLVDLQSFIAAGE